MSNLCLQMARLAGDRNHELLEYLLEIAAKAASDTNDRTLEAELDRRLKKMPVRFGVWDWDVTGDKNYCDAQLAEMFGLNAGEAAQGLEIAQYVKAIHPEDLPGFMGALQTSIRAGGEFRSQYRLVANNRTTFVLAKGQCFLDASKRPIRFPGVVIDISDEMRLLA
jgi:PAS domain-containing protein